MTRRRVVLAVILFSLAAVILVLMNRYTSFFVSPPTAARGGAERALSPYVDIYDPQTGARRGRLTAAKYATLADGSVEWSDVSLELLQTAFGDVKLTSKRAIVRLDQVAKKVSGRVVLSGDVTVNAVKDAGTSASGRFEDVSYDVGSKDVAADGLFEVVWGDGARLSGTKLRGNLQESAAKFTIEKDIKVTVGADLQPSWALEEGKADLTVTAGGPMDFDLAGSVVSFGGGVEVVRGGSGIICRDLKLSYALREAKGANGADVWEVKSFEASGGAKVTTPLFTAEGDELSWDASTLQARFKGTPAKIMSGKDIITAPLIEARLSNRRAPESIVCTGAGTADLASVQSIGAALGGASASGPLKIAWGKSAAYDVSAGTIVLEGAVKLEQGNCLANAESVNVRFDEMPLEGIREGIKRRVSMLEATRNVSATDGKRSVRAESVRYGRESDTVRLQGSPATLVTPEGEFTSRQFVYSVTPKTLSARQGAQILMRKSALAEVSGTAIEKPVAVTADQLDADFSGLTMTAKGTGAVKVDSGDGMLTCDAIKVEGVALDVKANEPVLGPSASVMVTGRGRVKFVRDQITASGEAFVYDHSAGAVTLDGADGKDVEISVGDSATVWAGRAQVQTRAGRVVCDRPRIFITARDTMMGFLPGETKKSGQGTDLVKVYLNAGGRMVLTRLADDKAQLAFDGGVEGVKRGSESRLDDRLTAAELVLDVRVEKPKEPDKGARHSKTTVSAAAASGGVYIRYAGEGGVLEGNGDSFRWDRDAAQGQLSGNPAVARYGQSPPARGGEITYDFAGRKVSVKGDRGGSITLER